MYLRKQIYSIDDVLSKINYNKSIKIDFDGDLMKMTSQRYLVFKYKGCKCVTCGLQGIFFAKEKTINQNGGFHFNLYGIKDGKEILFTKDHILPKSKGGLDKLNNYQTMCTVCNNLKGNKIV